MIDRVDFKKTSNIVVLPSSSISLRAIRSESHASGKEIGGVSCYKQDGDRVIVRDFIQLRPSSLNDGSFSFNEISVKSASDYLCSNRKPMMFHTHPSGNSAPSKKDRDVSISTGIPGCVVTASRISCYDGARDLPVLVAR